MAIADLNNLSEEPLNNGTSHTEEVYQASGKISKSCKTSVIGVYNLL